jgi:hypothetical protein
MLSAVSSLRRVRLLEVIAFAMAALSLTETPVALTWISNGCSSPADESISEICSW